MDKKKIILSLVGIAAILVPVVLLVVKTKQAQEQPNISTDERRIDPKTVEDAVRKAPLSSPIILPSPSPATASAEVEVEGSPSAQ